MSREKPRTLTRTLIVWIVCGLVVAAGGTLAVSWVSVDRNLRGDLERRAANLAQRGEAALKDAVWNLDQRTAKRVLQGILPCDDAFAARVTDQFGGVIAAHDGGVSLDGAAVQRVPIRFQDEIIGYFEIIMSAREINQTRRDVFRWVSLSTLISMIGLGLMVRWILRRHLARPLTELQRLLRAVAAGQDAPPLPSVRNAEFQNIADSANEMARQIGERTAQLNALSADLERQVRDRTADLARSNEKLSGEIHERLLAQQRVVAISGLERARIGRDLHDSLGQVLTGTAFVASALSARLRDSASPHAATASNVLENIQQAAVLTQAIARGLAPGVMMGSELIEEMKQLCDVTAKTSGRQCAFVFKGMETGIEDGEAGLQLYRIAQEAVNNAQRHANARRIDVVLELTPPSGRLQVCDDGTGLDAAVVPRNGAGGLGFESMRYRAEMLGGAFSVGPRVGGGTEVLVIFPVPSRVV